MSIRSKGRLTCKVELVSATEYTLENECPRTKRLITEIYNCITMRRLDTGGELRSFVRIGTKFQQTVQRMLRDHGRGHKFELYCQIPDGQKRNNHMVTRQAPAPHESTPYVKVSYCQTTPWSGKSKQEIADAKAAKIAARKAKLGL